MWIGYGKPAVDIGAFQAETPRYAGVRLLVFLSFSGSVCKGSTTVNESLALLPAGRKSPQPKLLSSDDESSPPTIPSTLRSIPHYYPSLPPKHTYLRTPVRIPTLVSSYPPHINAIAFTTEEAGIAISGEEIEKCKPCSRVA